MNIGNEYISGDTRGIDMDVADALFMNMGVMAFIMDGGTGELLYGRYGGSHLESGDNATSEVATVVAALAERLADEKRAHVEWELHLDDPERWYRVLTLRLKQAGEQCVYMALLSDETRLKSAYKSLALEASKDSMTGAFNYAYGIETLNGLIERGVLFSICYFDLDKLKEVNDTHGHTIGDSFILTFVDAIRGVIRTGDTLCRMGGDEFLLILPNTDEAAAGLVLERVSVKVGEINASGKFPLDISFSSGLECFHANSEHLDPQKIIAIADMKMYGQKKNKRGARPGLTASPE